MRRWWQMRAGRGRTAVRVRRWLLAGAILLVAGLAGVLGYAKYRAHRFVAGLPRMLGADIRSETNGFTYSQSVKGRTLFTIHASKAIQRQNGKTTLHDVDITLYSEPGSKRADRIRGAEFEYDQPNGVVRAAGEVYLDLASPAGDMAASKTATNDKRMQVTTSGLVFLEKLGVAATDEPIRFVYGTTSGEARGADYDADSGMLRLRHEVHVESVSDGRRSTVTASAAELDRLSHKATLREAHLLSENGAVSAATMFLSLRQDGSLEGVQADGDVDLVSAGGDHVKAPRLTAAVSEANHLQQVHMFGGLRYAGTGRNATAAEGTLLLDAAGQPAHAVLLHGVHLQTAGKGSDQREVSADRVDADLLTGAEHQVVAKDVIATGSARIVTTSQPLAPARATKTVLAANTLHALLSPHNGRWSIQQVQGQGSTRLDESDAKGLERISTGDALAVSFRQDQVSQGETAIKSVVQQGHVALVEKRPAEPATKGAAPRPAAESHAVAQRAEYNGVSEELTLDGSPELFGAGTQLAADRIVISRRTGDAVASGAVKGSFWTAAAGEAAQRNATHVVAEDADLTNGNDRVVFRAVHRFVRLWDSSSQLEAPVIELERSSGKLLAHGAEGGPGLAVVHATLPASASTSSGNAGQNRTGPVRISSRSLSYTQGDDTHPGRAVFTGEVRVEQVDGVLTADSATAFFHANATAFLHANKSDEAPGKTSPSGSLLGGSVDRVIAAGNVALRQPGRRGTGEQLIYTASDGRFELTGTPAQRPEIIDSVRGSITGTSLIFHAGDDSVEVSGKPGSRVRSVTHAKEPTGRPN